MGIRCVAIRACGGGKIRRPADGCLSVWGCGGRDGTALRRDRAPLFAASSRYRPGPPLRADRLCLVLQRRGASGGAACLTTRLPGSRELLGAWTRGVGDTAHYMSWIAYTHRLTCQLLYAGDRLP